MQKKGNIANIAPVIIILIVAAAALFLGLQVTEELRDTTATYTTNVVNETGWINSSGYTLLGVSTPGYNSPTITIITNGTSGTTITSANYTLVGNVIYNASSKIWNVANVSYSYLRGDESYKAANRTITGLGTFADFWSIIVLAFVISIIVGILLLVLSNRKVK